MQISAIVLTKNSEKSLEKTLQSIVWCDEIIVVDDNSTDTTINIAKKYTTKIFTHSLLDDFSAQRNFGLERAEGDWVMFIDSDEIVSTELRSEIQKIIADPKNDFLGFFIRRIDTMWGRELLHGETGNIWLLRLAKKGTGNWHGRVHEIWEIAGQKGKLRNPLLHFPHPTVHDFLRQINYYSTIRAKELYEKHVQASWVDIIVYPKMKFFVNYMWRKGYKDGIPGFLVALIMSFHSFLVRGKLWQLQNSHK